MQGQPPLPRHKPSQRQKGNTMHVFGIIFILWMLVKIIRHAVNGTL